MEVKQLSMAKHHDDLERRCSTLNSRWKAELRTLEQCSHAVEGRVATLEQWGDELAESLGL